MLKDPFTEPTPGPDKMSTEEASQQLEAGQGKSKNESCFLPVTFIHTVELGDKRKQRSILDHKAFAHLLDLSEYNVSAREKEEKKCNKACT